MANKSATIKLRRDSINKYSSYPNFIPLMGEICIVDPTATSPWSKAKTIRFKVGDGTTKYSELPFVDEVNKNFLVGYVYNGSFYLDAQHTQEDENLSELILYVDLHTGVIYYFDGYELQPIKMTIPNADSTQPGVMKLYQTLGQNIDGTMSQKAITDAIGSIRLAVVGSEEFGLVNPNDEE